MSLTPDVLSLLQSQEFQIVLRQEVQHEMDIRHIHRMRKYKFAGFLVLVFFGFMVAATAAGLLIDVCERWLFGR